MSDSRTKNAVRNMVYGVVNRVVTLIFPFITRTIILYLLGASYLGIGTLFSSVLSFLSLAELGLSSAIIYSMYKPIAQNDKPMICALLNYYRKLYRIIGAVILALGTLLVPAVPFFMKGGAPKGINAYLLYYLYLINSVISYFFAGYRQSLLTAHQRTDITNKIATFVNIFIQLFQILALYLTRSMYVYAFVPILGTVLTNAANYFVTKRRYPDICCKGNIPDELVIDIKKRITGLFGTKLNSIVVHSADTIVISSFLGLTFTAQFGNYYYIMNAVCGFIMILYSSITAGVGNKLVSDSIETNFKLFKNLSFANAFIVTICTTCFVCLYEPFMKIWVGEELCLGLGFAILMAAYFFVYDIQRTILTFKDAAGLWFEDRYRPYVSMVFNVISNIVLVQFIGIYGIVVSSVLSFLISVPWTNWVLFKYLFERSALKNLFSLLKYTVVAIISCTISYLVCLLCNDGIVGLFIRLIISVVISSVTFMLFFIKSEEKDFVKNLIYKMLNKIFNFQMA